MGPRSSSPSSHLGFPLCGPAPHDDPRCPAHGQPVNRTPLPGPAHQWLNLRARAPRQQPRAPRSLTLSPTGQLPHVLVTGCAVFPAQMRSPSALAHLSSPSSTQPPWPHSSPPRSCDSASPPTCDRHPLFTPHHLLASLTVVARPWRRIE